MGDYNSVQESWNMATATMQRLNKLLIQSSFYAQNGDLIGWFKVLMDLRRNLFPFMEDAEFKSVEDKFKMLPENWSTGGRVNKKYYSTVNKLFDEAYMIFIKTMKSNGLLLPKSRDASRAVIGG